MTYATLLAVHDLVMAVIEDRPYDVGVAAKMLRDLMDG